MYHGQGHFLLFLEHDSLQRGLSSFRPRQMTNQIAGFHATMFQVYLEHSQLITKKSKGFMHSLIFGNYYEKS